MRPMRAIITMLSASIMLSCVAEDPEADETDEVTERSEDLSCISLAFIDVNPVDSLGLPPEQRRALVADMSKCDEYHTAHVIFRPYVGEFSLGEFETKMALPPKSCPSIGGRFAIVDEEAIIGEGAGNNIWTSFTVEFIVDDDLSFTWPFPEMLVDDDLKSLGDPPLLDHRPLIKQDDVWHLAPVGTIPHCEPVP